VVNRARPSTLCNGCVPTLWWRQTQYPILGLARTGGAGAVIHRCLYIFGQLPAESPAGQRLRDVTGLQIGHGTVQVSRLVIARNLPGRECAR
jgi:alkylation response protein AidB-like acyl-CoA dehydrogenase